MNFTIDSNDPDIREIAERLETIDIVFTCAPAGMSEKQGINYLKVRRLLAKARVIIEDADNIAQCLWGG